MAATKYYPQPSVENCDRNLAVNGSRQRHASHECGARLPRLAAVLRSINTRSANEFAGISGVVPPIRRSGNWLERDRTFRTIFVLPQPPAKMAALGERWGSIFNRFSGCIGRLDSNTTAQI